MLVPEALKECVVIILGDVPSLYGEFGRPSLFCGTTALANDICSTGAGICLNKDDGKQDPNSLECTSLRS